MILPCSSIPYNNPVYAVPDRLHACSQNLIDIASTPVWGNVLHKWKHNRKVLHSCVMHSKMSSFQDFQGYAKPLNLLPSSEAEIYIGTYPEIPFTSDGIDESCSLYLVQLGTSKEYGSCMNDLNAAILLCLIDVNGDSILQRISSASIKVPQTFNKVDDNHLCFLRCSIDRIVFKGSKLGPIAAIWIGLETGSWKLGSLRLQVISSNGSSSETTEEENSVRYSGVCYDFEAVDVLLGDGGGSSMVELRPSHVTSLPTIDSLTTSNINFLFPDSSSEVQTISKEESMKEYTDLKFSLLFYDVMFVATGSFIVFFSSEAALPPFMFGGVCGFLYLLLLQRSVDSLTIDQREENLVQGLKGSLPTLGFVLLFAAIFVKYGNENISVILTPLDLILGIGGFLTSKIAVMLAAFKPLSSRTKS